MFQPTCSFHCLSLSVTGTGRLTQSLFGSLVLAVLHVLSALCQVEKYRFRGMGKKSSRELSKGKVTERAEGRKIIISQSHVSRQQWQLWFDQTTCDNLTSCSSRLLQAANISSWVETYLLGSAGLAMGNQACCAKSNDEKAWGCLDFELCRQQHCDTGSLFLVRFLR